MCREMDLQTCKCLSGLHAEAKASRIWQLIREPQFQQAAVGIWGDESQP